MSGQAYLTSARIAEAVGTCVGYAENEDSFLDVIRLHWNSVNGIDSRLVPTHMYKAAEECWRSAYELGSRTGYRNAQVTVLAPTTASELFSREDPVGQTVNIDGVPMTMSRHKVLTCETTSSNGTHPTECSRSASDCA